MTKSTIVTLTVVVRKYAKADYTKCSGIAKFQLVFLLVSKCFAQHCRYFLLLHINEQEGDWKKHRKGKTVHCTKNEVFH